jgi:hypothetical protein
VALFRRKAKDSSGPEDVYRGLRAMALEAPSFGVVVDIARADGYVTLVGLEDNTTSMYTSGGGGVIGAGEHAPVAAATHRLLETVQAHLAAFVDADTAELPPAGVVRIHVLAPAGPRHRDVSEPAFWGETSDELTPVIAQIQNMLTALREHTPT